ncbi:MAG: hypothetical protein ACRD0U_01235 [Acidimicrobiales bacterium]
MSAAAVDVLGEFLGALDALGLEVHIRPGSGRGGWDAAGSIEGVDVVVDVKANPTVGDVFRLAQLDSAGAYKVLAAPSLWTPTRDALDAHDVGWFDGRGHLRLWRRPLLVDADVPTARPGGAGPSRWRIDSPSALDVALAVLDGTAATGVRATATALGRSPGTVSKQLAALRARYLVDEDARPLVPALFEAVLEVWQPNRVPLASLPDPRGGPVSERLGVRFDDPASPGWVLADARAAAAWRAPMMLPTDAAPDFYVPDPPAAARSRALLGDADYGRHACTVAVAPCPYVCRRRHDRSAATGESYPAPAPIVAALDMAADPARGREVLEQWSQDLPAELPRVW